MQHNIAGSTPPTQDEYDEAVFGWGLAMYNIILSEHTEEKVSQLRTYMKRVAKSEVDRLRDSAAGMGDKKSPETPRDIDKYEALYVRFLECDALANADHRMQVVSEESRYLARKYSAAAFTEMDALSVKITATIIVT